MDSQNFSETLALCRTEEEQQKVKMFRDFDPEGTGNVPDPWYGGMDGFEIVWSIVRRTSASLLEALRRELAA
jgi:protein-tyrosine phosphatase